MLSDAHIHIGQFYDIYTSPAEMNSFLKDVGVEAVAFSSTTTCEENYSKVLDEVTEFCELFGRLCIPILWVTPSLLKDSYLLEKFKCNVNWKCLKVHPQLSPKEWNAKSDNYTLVLELAKQLNVPILIHTGVVQNCHPLQLESLFRANRKQTFIMAHGRPFNEALYIMQKYDNVYVDTAFMLNENIVNLVELGLADRILWGTDYPIIKFYERDINYYNYYKQLLFDLKEKIRNEDYSKITELNFLSLYCLSK